MKQTKIFALIGLLLALTQTLFDVLNVANVNDHTKLYIGAGGMLISIVTAGFKQLVDNCIDNKTLVIQLLLFIAFVCGGVLDHFDKLAFLDESARSVIRVAMTYISLSIPLIVTKYKEFQ